MTGSILYVFSLPKSFGHEGARQNTGTITAPIAETHRPTCTPPTCDVSRGSLTVAMPEAGDFMESLKPHTANIFYLKYC
jgi:hypothetical protein